MTAFGKICAYCQRAYLVLMCLPVLYSHEFFCLEDVVDRTPQDMGLTCSKS